ncbi:MAG: SGNH/GDSL hydrolase family protein [Clostridiales bacterium]|nr:SGNH/GDSL hydrolase family protein [Clostridiales bacterium]
MKRLSRLSGIVAGITAFCITGICACTQPAPPPSGNNRDPLPPPDIEYTIDDTLPSSGKDANATEFYVKNVQQTEDSSLEGMTIYWLGSSVTYGASSGGESMADFLAAKTGAICKKEAVSGTTLFDDGGNGDSGARSYTRRLTESKVFNKNEQIDAFICQISTNDAISYRLKYRGSVTDDTVEDKEEFDRGTTLGGVEYILAYVWETWGCPVYFYSGSYFGDNGSGESRTNGDPSGTEYGKLVEEVKAVVKKWQGLGYEVDVIDLFNDEDFNAQVSESYYKWCTSDPIHPKRAGYLNWWMPYFEQFLTVKLDPRYY